MTIIYFVGGVNGAGKSTILNLLPSVFPEPVEIVRASRELMKQFKLQAGDYSTLQEISEAEKRRVSDLLLCRVIDAAKPRVVTIIGAHYFHYLHGRLIPAIGPWARRLDALFVIEANPAILLTRIYLDYSIRNRAAELFGSAESSTERLDILAKYVLATRGLARRLGWRHGIPCYVIDNSTDDLHAAISAICAADAQIRKGVQND